MAKKAKTALLRVPLLNVPSDYPDFLQDLKSRIQAAQLKAAAAVNLELTSLYWDIGQRLSKKTHKGHWGSKVVECLAKDLANAFPGVSGFSKRNLELMRQFAESYPDGICETAVSQMPWGHNIVLLQRLEHLQKRIWYAQQAIKNGWSRNALVMWIESDLYRRRGKAVNNFALTLPGPHSDLAVESLKDPYCLDFLTLSTEAHEKEIEQGLINHLQKFLLELGQGFAFVGRQYHLEVGGEDSYIDLLFYHFRLKCFIVIELKAGPFKATDAGQVNFYLAAVDKLLKQPGDNPTIGIILCKERNKVTAEYALSNLKSPIGVSRYTVNFMEKLPKKFKDSLPTIAELEAELSDTKKTKKLQKKSH
jgi:predicted nuclease of restriction endonuclease-like (RecB) superfamily